MPTPQVDIKSKSADWRVNELGFPEAAAVTSMPAAGKASPEAGAHTCFYVEKTDLNTLDIVRTLSHEIGVPQHEIGYAGRKDKWAVTRQWISAPRIESWPNIPGTQCLEQMPRRKKLRIGELLGNEFTLTLRNVQGLSPSQVQQLRTGFANRFGSQRVSEDNQAVAIDWLLHRRQRKGVAKTQQGWYLSVARGVLFNKFVARRESIGPLESALEGDVLVAGFPSAPMWGRGRSQSQAEARDIEQLVTSEMADVCEALEYAGVAQGRRAMFVRPRELQVQSIDAGTWVLKFILPPGSYATTLLGEIATVRDLGGQRG